MNMREALLAMGYREVLSGKWAKPVGYSLFSYNEETSTWACWFRSADDNEMVRWASAKFEEKLWTTDTGEVKPLVFLKHQEAWESRVNVGSLTSEFELSAIDL